jgi:hypothetical protein
VKQGRFSPAETIKNRVGNYRGENRGRFCFAETIKTRF